MSSIADWPHDYAKRWPHFTVAEVSCRCGCGGVPTPGFMDFLEAMRDELGFPLPVTSGFRCDDYDDSIGGAGVHPSGEAADVAVGRDRAFRFVALAMKRGATGVGVKGRGDGRFVHVDRLPVGGDHPRPRLWSYDAA